ncbi:sigma-70 family RNA polymerase sigma factor [Roseiconus nitratireducens]|uniref:Sigma-70 family RNA polymerase sigma factor n=1 Tax=Roseiconus nitratireducens TaxID=2605748 RepID=A0A5M6CW41_9BACT|nr:sigma-70 family RNA polymerase sigma factor [Roseiconus nitratireducens]KAA5539447.1 sigma-70 family RNA polymerase sigma factor [Roseiconus nitratireducens]
MTSQPAANDSFCTDDVIAAASGDRSAFARLIDRHAGMVTGVAYAVLGDFSSSEDAGQEAFLEAWKKLPSLREPGKFVPWICAIARHRALDLARRSKRHPMNAGTFDPEPSSDQIREESYSEEERELVWEALEKLPEAYRETLVLYHRGEQSVTQVAETLGESPATIRKRLSRGRKLLRTEVERVISKTLHGTVPKAVFAGAILGSLPGNLQAASVLAGTSTGAKGIAGKTGLAALGAGMTGGVVGMLGGIAGAGIGTYASYKTTPFKSQRRVLVGSFVALVLMSIVFLFLVRHIAARQAGAQALSPESYRNLLLTLILGFQATLFLVLGGAMWHVKRLGHREREKGTEPEADFAASMSRQDLSGWAYRSDRSFLGLPWVEIRFGRRDDQFGLMERETAVGWIAIGDHARGILFAGGGTAVGLVACGGVCLGGLAVGGICVGLFAFGGLCLGAVALGGLAIGGIAVGGITVGLSAVGGIAFGGYVCGGLAHAWIQEFLIPTPAGPAPTDPSTLPWHSRVAWQFALGLQSRYASSIILLVILICMGIAFKLKHSLAELKGRQSSDG